MLHESDTEGSSGQERDVLAEATNSYLENKIAIRIVVGEWDPDSIIPRLTPVTAMDYAKPGAEYPGAIKRSHVHFDDVMADVGDGGVHRVDVITYPTEESAKGVFLHKADFGKDRIFFVVGPADLDPLKIIEG